MNTHTAEPADTEGNPSLPHLSTEFFIWLWFASERDGGTMSLPERVGVVDVWVEDRLSFRGLDEEKARTVVAGENTSSSLEARAALATGKVVRDLQLHLRREEREYTVTLRGVHLDLAGAKLPPHAGEGEDGLLYERMYLYEDLWFVIEGLYRQFARERTHASWRHTLDAIREWVAGAPANAVLPPSFSVDADHPNPTPTPSLTPSLAATATAAAAAAAAAGTSMEEGGGGEE